MFVRKLSETPALTAGAATMQYDVAGRRTRLTWSDGFYVTYDYDVLGEMIAVRENGATSGAGVLATFAYDDLGHRTGLARGNGVNDTYGYDPAGRLTALSNNHATYGNAYAYAYDPAGQMISRSMTNDAYAWTQAVALNRAYTVNGLNQYTASGSITPTYDARGNLTSAGSTAYVYDVKNHLTTFGGTTTLLYDGLGRLASQSTPATRYVQEGADLIAETDASNNILRRYVHGPASDEVLVWYEGSGTTDRRWLERDERGSTTLVTNASGTMLGIDAYDEYGIPQSTNIGRFQYTGQTWLPELGMYYYKARIYSATLGRFLQTDPIGYDDGPNWYAYAHGDPINGSDPSGDLAVYVTGSILPVGNTGSSNHGTSAGSNGSSSSNGGNASSSNGTSTSESSTSSGVGQSVADIVVNGSIRETIVTASLGSSVLRLLRIFRPFEIISDFVSADAALAPRPFNFRDPSTLTGVSSSQALAYARSLGWTELPTARGGGIRFISPVGGGSEIIRVMPGTANGDGVHGGPYVAISTNGKITRVPLEGNPTLP